ACSGVRRYDLAARASVSASAATPFPTRVQSTPSYTRELPAEERIVSLDILRGVALLGMLLVHFTSLGASNGEEDALSRFVTFFLEARFFTMFAILFGVSFAVQLERADSRGRTITATFIRRLAALAVFGLIAEIGFGYRVLLPYALSGLALLPIRRWS